MSRQNNCVRKARCLSGLPLLFVVQVFCLLFFSACSSYDDDKAMLLNEKSYYYHYRSLDSVRVYADSVLQLDHIGSTARAEALNHLAFYNIGKMHYDVADSLINLVYATTDNQTELCIAGLQMMRMCQRRSDNKLFYEYRQRVQNCFGRIYEDAGNDILHTDVDTYHNSHSHRRLIYAETEYRLVMSVYNYYLGLTEDAARALNEMDSIPCLKKDTVQYVAYLYNIGSGGILTKGSKEDIHHQELERLMQCFVISSDLGLTYWKANAMQALAEHLIQNEMSTLPDISLAQRYLNTYDVPDSLLAGNLAEQSLEMFREYGDVYQQAATWRTLAYCYRQLNDNPGAIYSLDKALNVDNAIGSVPALLASIHEQFSLAYSALNLKSNSDYHRNIYLDLYEDTRQDRELEARIENLNINNARLDMLVYIIIAVALLLLCILIFLVVKRRRMLNNGRNSARVTALIAEKKQRLESLDSQLEELQEQCDMKSLELMRQQETYAEQRSKMHLINSLTPLIDRMLHETKCLSMRSEDDDVREDRCEYISELLSRINQQNNFLTEWIQMKRGELSLRIESFPLTELFNILSTNGAVAKRQGISLNVLPTDACVKADRTLTLFMLNTLCDNARKFTPEGGTITVSADDVADDMVEISIADTGVGMTDEQVQHLFDVKPIVDEVLEGHQSTQSRSHGFGLINCKGIIEKYKKTNALFSRCALGVESRVGEGSRFYFRLPKGIRKTLSVVILLLTLSLNVHANNASASTAALADSIYFCNINSRYHDAVEFAREYLRLLNEQHVMQLHDNDTLMLNDTILANSADVRWLRGAVDIDYQTLMSVRNEIAVAALALHDWQLYGYNNNIYTQLYRELSVDHTLEEYYSQLSSAQFNSNIAIVLLVLLILLFIPIYYFAYYRHVILDVRNELDRMYGEIRHREQQCNDMAEQLSRMTFEYDRLHVLNNVMNNSFSALKHETMYYPSRLQQLLLDVTDNATELDEVARHYRAVYGILAAQAQYNCRYHLPADVLRKFMHRLISQLASTPMEQIECEEQQQYSIYRFTLSQSQNEPNRQTVRLNTLTLVVRDLGELYDLRRCGVNRDGDNNIVVTAPRL